MIEGVDYLGTGPTPAELVAAGKHFRLGYLDRPDSSLTRADIDAHHAAGIDVGLLAEWGEQRMLGGRTAGVVDGQRAGRALSALGAPNGVTVFFCADWDVQRIQLPVVEAYLNGVISVFALPDTGLYGGLSVIQHMQAAGLAAHFYQTYAWSYGIWAAGLALQQYSNGQSIGGQEVDFDRAMVAEWGQWKAGDPMGLSVRLAATATTAAPWGSFGTAKVSGAGHSAVRVSDRKYVALTAGQDLGCVQLGTLTAPLDAAAGNRSDVYVTNINGEEHVVLRTDVTFSPMAPPVPPAPPTQTLTVTGQGLTLAGPK
jgi:Rv2525c-like, glycoside hydrolase-like domain